MNYESLCTIPYKYAASLRTVCNRNVTEYKSIIQIEQLMSSEWIQIQI